MRMRPNTRVKPLATRNSNAPKLRPLRTSCPTSIASMQVPPLASGPRGPSWLRRHEVSICRKKIGGCQVLLNIWVTIALSGERGDRGRAPETRGPRPDRGPNPSAARSDDPLKHRVEHVDVGLGRREPLLEDRQH